MIYQTSLKEQLENIMIVTLSYLKESASNIYNLDTLKTYYNRYISGLYNKEIESKKLNLRLNSRSLKIY